MMNIEDIIHAKDKKNAFINYRSGIYYRGNVRTKTGQKKISDYIIKQEEAAGFKVQGAYLKRIRYFVDGVAIGSSEYIKDHIKKLKLKGGYLKRQNPIKLKNDKINQKN